MSLDESFFSILGAKKAEVSLHKINEESTQEPVFKEITAKNLFSHPETHPVILDLVLLKNFELEWFEWLPDTLLQEIELTFKTSIAEVNRNKILAVKTLHVTDAFWNQWEIYEKTIHALNGVSSRVDVIQPVDVPALLVGVDIANSIRKEEFNEEVARYSAACFLNDGIVYAPEPLAFCQQYVSQPTFKCNHCRLTGSILAPFSGYCPACTQEFEGEHPFSFKPNKEAVARNAGQDLTFSMENDPNPIKARFEELDKMNTEQLAQNIKEVSEDVQAAKLIAAVDYQKYRLKQLAEQLTALHGWLEVI